MRKLLYVSLLIIGVVWVWPSKAESEPDSPQDIVSIAEELIGAPYRAGGRSPEGFDCSGFVSYVFEKSGLKVPRDSRSQGISGTKVALEAALPGDLIFFKGTDLESNRIGHSGIIISGVGQEVEVIHACNRGVVKEKIFELTYYRDRYVTVRRM